MAKRSKSYRLRPRQKPKKELTDYQQKKRLVWLDKGVFGLALVVATGIVTCQVDKGRATEARAAEYSKRRIEAIAAVMRHFRERADAIGAWRDYVYSRLPINRGNPGYAAPPEAKLQRRRTASCWRSRFGSLWRCRNLLRAIGIWRLTT